MASELRVNTLKDASGNNSVATSVVFNGTAKAWMSLNGSSFGLRDSYNVSSATDNGTGDHTASWTSAMSNANYSALYSAGVKNVITAQERLHTIAAGSYRIETSEDGGSATDSTHVMLGIHGDLA